MNSLSLALVATLCLSAFADKGPEFCVYSGTASQADDGDGSYTYCNEDGTLTETGASSPAKITTTVSGGFGECKQLEPTLTDEELEEQLGLETRPNYAGFWNLEEDGEWSFTLNQYSSSTEVPCSIIQRQIIVTWGDEFCIPAQEESRGLTHEMMFTEPGCGAFNGFSDDEKIDSALNGFSNIADEIYDPYPALTAFVGDYEYTTDHGVLGWSFTQDATPNPTQAYCYGFGNRFAPPVFIPLRYTDPDSGLEMLRNAIFSPTLPTVDEDGTFIPGWACGTDCSDDTNAAFAVYGATLVATGNNDIAVGEMLVSFANSTCGHAYSLMEGYDAEANALTAGLASENFFAASLIMDLATPRACGVCEENPTNLLSTLGDVLNLAGMAAGAESDPALAALGSAASRMTYCQDVVLESVLRLTPEDNFDFGSPADCEGEAADSSAAAVSTLSAIFVAMAVALRQ